ncbi:hypothetical protein NIES593_19290 [Hydrococcus rivularis NIES-593]|uniref:Peptidase S1 n=2 Tax=Hydrococcus TaxID=1616833 RepID=A0A1U7H9P5_9CYAN|nr:hypothetical protein NIES593_19290 [Hydrococcus rivularis NIES-593]
MQVRWRSLGLSLFIGSLVVGLPGNTHNAELDLANQKVQSEQLRDRLSEEQLYREAQAITVRVLSSLSLVGSGTIVRAEGNTYFVLTNAHVLRAAPSPYQIQTPDGAIYEAAVITPASFQKNDLEVLQFSAAKPDYSAAKLGASATLTQGEEVFAAGFPFSLEKGTSVPAPSKNVSSPQYPTDSSFAFREGRVVLVLDKALEGGYQVGYTNEIERGMSGGPLLNRAGELVGVHGMQAYPLWEAPDYYEDGSAPPSPLQQTIARSNWAIPTERIVQPAATTQLW